MSKVGILPLVGNSWPFGKSHYLLGHDKMLQRVRYSYAKASHCYQQKQMILLMMPSPLDLSPKGNGDVGSGSLSQALSTCGGDLPN
jgi:hypothetical protein